ncbi:MAG: type II toxin-antitoxin system VapC family toxin [Propionibacteriaceae bacterium]|jgi:predicted nucleic acid-binding protein|nr:type II toxin-antitoxin system VapC family toxin [Propionibacteriaceae bacterium]
MGLIYLDTSAYLSAFLADASEHEFYKALWDEPSNQFASSRLLRTESLRQCVRFLEEGLDVGTVAEIRQRLAAVSLLSVSDAILERAETFTFQLKTLDAIHLASAMELAPDLEGVATKDAKMRQRAAILGLPLLTLDRPASR